MKKYRNILIIILINILVIALSVKTNIFGSTMDFLNQHVVFPEYLRQTFYETKKIIPSLMSLGAGQNIYNIAYYGLLNPIIMLSYLFPFIKMIDYIIITNIILLIISIILFYKFMQTKFDEKISFLLTIIFSLSGPLIFQFHRQYMFVNYMPFLILSLLNIDKKKYINLTIDIFLIITTSFYFSIPSIIVIILYFLYNNHDKLKETLKLITSIITAVMMSAILLLPTLNIILETRTGKTANLISLLIPNLNLDNLLYGSYSPGLTSILIISLIYLIYKKEKKNIYLLVEISLLAFLPLTLYLLNGGLYLRAKCLIPLLPLLVYIIGIFLNDLLKNKIDIKKLLKIIFFAHLIILINYHVLAYYIDLLFMLILIILYKKIAKENIIIAPLIILSLVMCINLNNNETYINKKQYENINNKEIKLETSYRTINLNNKSESVNKTNNYTTSIYSSTINKYYKNMYHETFKINNSEINTLSLPTTTNVLFNKYMGVKYIISDKELLTPYKKIENNLYELEALPLGYATNNTVNKEYYDKLEYPYNLDILLNYVIDENSINKPTSNIKEISLEYEYELGSNIELKDHKLYVKKEDNIKINLKENMSDKILFIDIYDMQVQKDDIWISINGEKNLLTKESWIYPNNNKDFHYCLSNVNDKLEITLAEGIYNVENIKTYILDKNITLNPYDEFKIETYNTEEIYGKINVKEDGYFILKIPYDKGFKIKMDNIDIDYQKQNDTFIGFKIKKGNHEIKITYEPPYLNIGKLISLVGIILLITRIIYEKKNNNVYHNACNNSNIL